MSALKDLASHPLPRQFLRFGIVGTIGFVVDASVLTIVLATTGLGFYWGRVVSFLVAATATWALNRRFTFQDRSGRRVRQWGRFVLVNISGGAVNYATYSALIAASATFRSWPVLAVAAGALMGMFVNFAASKRVVVTQS